LFYSVLGFGVVEVTEIAELFTTEKQRKED
jgi:hypothetical protein